MICLADIATMSIIAKEMSGPIYGVADGILPEVVAGREQPGRVAPDSFDRFGGKAGHQFTNPMMDYGASKDEIRVKASGLMTYWDNGGSLFCFAYYDIKLARLEGAWKIKRNDVRLMT